MEAGAPIPDSAVAQSKAGASVGLIHFALAMGGFAIGTTEFATMSLLPYFGRDLGIDAPQAGHVISAYALGVVVGAPLIAVLSARMAKRSVLILLMGAFALANGLSALAPSYGWMLLFRFCSGLPHGAYFGIAMLVAAMLVPPDKRIRRWWGEIVLLAAFTVATIVGVPLANWLGQSVGWRWGFGVVALLALMTAVMVALYAPRDRAGTDASPLRELGALRRGQVWLTLAIGAVGFGGVFAVYTYLADTLEQVTGAAPHVLPWVLAVFGIGMTIGNLLVPRFADRALKLATAAALLDLSCLVPGAVPARGASPVEHHARHVRHRLRLCPCHRIANPPDGRGRRCPAAGGGTQPFGLQCTTPMPLGPWLGGLAIAAGYGWTSTGWVGCALALGGLAFWAASAIGMRRVQAAASCSPS